MASKSSDDAICNIDLKLTAIRGHLQTDFVTLNVIMKLGGEGVLPHDVINLFS